MNFWPLKIFHFQRRDNHEVLATDQWCKPNAENELALAMLRRRPLMPNGMGARRLRGDDEASAARNAARVAYRHHHSTQHCATRSNTKGPPVHNPHCHKNIACNLLLVDIISLFGISSIGCHLFVRNVVTYCQWTIFERTVSGGSSDLCEGELSSFLRYFNRNFSLCVGQCLGHINIG